MRTTIAAAALALFAAPFAPSASAADSSAPLYKLVTTVSLGAPERWDYVVFDPVSSRIYVAHGTEVSVVDAKTNQVTGTIGTMGGGTHGIAIVHATGTGYTDDGKAGVVVPFDLASLATGTPIPTAPDADGIDFDPASGHVLVINGDSGSVSAIDPAKNVVVATIENGAGLEFGDVDGKGHMYVDGVENHDIVAINTMTNKVEAHWPMPTCEKPHGFAIDREARRIFATCANKVMVVIDADSGRNIATLPIGAYSDGAAYDPVRKLALSPNGDGTLTVVKEKDPDTFAVVGTVNTAPSARTIAIDPATGRLYLAAADIAKLEPPAAPGGRPHVTFVPGSLKLLVFDPAQ